MIMMARLEPCSVLGEVSIATTAGGHLPESARLQSGEAARARPWRTLLPTLGSDHGPDTETPVLLHHLTCKYP